MNDKIKSFFKSFFSNNEVLKAGQFSFIVVALVFVINVSLISVPNFVGRMNSVENIDNLIGIEEALSEMYDDQFDCQIIDEMMDCNILNGTIYNGYEISFVDEIIPDDIDSSVIQFTEEYMAIVYVDDNDMTFSISGDYSLIRNFDFSEVSTADFGDLTKTEYYFETNDNLLTNVYHSSLNQQLALIYMSQFMQVFIYLIVVTLIFMLVNFKADVKKVTFQNANKIIVVAMTGPALLVAIFGVFLPAWASIAFFLIFAIRVMFIYYKLNFNTETYTE